MHLNYHYLKFLCPALETQLIGKSILSCFSHKDREIQFELSSELHLKLLIDPPRIFFSFPEKISRAKQNSKDIFQAIWGSKISVVKVIPNDRSFFLKTESGHLVLFKLHGNKSNCLLFSPSEDLPIEIFIRKFKDDLNLKVSDLKKELDLTFENFEKLDGNASRFIPTLGKIPREWLKERGYPESDLEKKWMLLEELRDLLSTPHYRIIKQAQSYELSLLPHPDEITVKEFGDPIQATNELFYYGVIRSQFEQGKARLVKEQNDQIKRIRSFIEKAKANLETLKSSPPPSQLADVIMANLHQFKNGEARIYDFYTQEERTISIPANQTPQAYAEKLYKKNKNRKLEWEQLEKNIKHKQKSLEASEIILEELQTVKDYKSLKKFIKSKDINPKGKGDVEMLPFKEFTYKGYPIWVGKSAKANDEMLRKYSKKNDYWLHARNVAGSHVVIKWQGMAEPKDDILETAGSLAAHYSKAKSQPLAPVIFTQVKFVRKVKGGPAGSVAVDKEKVIMVEPKSPEVLFGKSN